MKKIFIIIMFLIFIMRVKAIATIEIDGNNLIPVFSNKLKVYNYYTSKDSILVSVIKEKDETISGEGTYELKDGKNEIIVSNGKDKYIINVFKNYKKENNEVYLVNLSIEGYDINFDKDIHEYDITIGEEDSLNINYELSNDNAYVSVSGNGNFNNSVNAIIINVDNKESYKINIYKTISVISIKEDNNEVVFSTQKKEIVAFIIITISCIFVFLFYYTLFINKTTLHI